MTVSSSFMMSLRSGKSKSDDSYIALIAKAILKSDNNRCTLKDIYSYISSNHSDFTEKCAPSWKNSVRHNLSLNECFIKTGRCESGKGNYWSIHPANLMDFARSDFRRRRARAQIRLSSTNRMIPGTFVVPLPSQVYSSLPAPLHLTVTESVSQHTILVGCCSKELVNESDEPQEINDSGDELDDKRDDSGEENGGVTYVGSEVFNNLTTKLSDHKLARRNVILFSIVNILK